MNSSDGLKHVLCELDKPLYHYTSRDAVIGITESKSLWASSIYEMNDKSEVEHLRQKTIERLQGIANSYNNPHEKSILSLFLNNFQSAPLESLINVFVVSFSEKRDDLSQWRAYCPASGGVCLGFHPRTLTRLCEEKDWYSVSLAKCIYGPTDTDGITAELAEKTISLFWDRLLEKYGPRTSDVSLRAFVRDFDFLADDMKPIFVDLIHKAPLLKHPSFSDEQEWRLIIWQSKRSLTNESSDVFPVFFRNGASSITPYIEVDIRDPSSVQLELERITVGPGPRMPHSAYSIETLCEERNVALDQDVQLSSVPFRNW